METKQIVLPKKKLFLEKISEVDILLARLIWEKEKKIYYKMGSL